MCQIACIQAHCLHPLSLKRTRCSAPDSTDHVVHLTVTHTDRSKHCYGCEDNWQRGMPESVHSTHDTFEYFTAGPLLHPYNVPLLWAYNTARVEAEWTAALPLPTALVGRYRVLLEKEYLAFYYKMQPGKTRPTAWCEVDGHPHSTPYLPPTAPTTFTFDNRTVEQPAPYGVNARVRYGDVPRKGFMYVDEQAKASQISPVPDTEVAAKVRDAFGTAKTVYRCMKISSTEAQCVVDGSHAASKAKIDQVVYAAVIRELERRPVVDGRCQSRAGLKRDERERERFCRKRAADGVFTHDYPAVPPRRERSRAKQPRPRIPRPVNVLAPVQEDGAVARVGRPVMRHTHEPSGPHQIIRWIHEVAMCLPRPPYPSQPSLQTRRVQGVSRLAVVDVHKLAFRTAAGRGPLFIGTGVPLALVGGRLGYYGYGGCKWGWGSGVIGV